MPLETLTIPALFKSQKTRGDPNGCSYKIKKQGAYFQYTVTQNKHPQSIKGACGHSKKLLDPSKTEAQHGKPERLPLSVWHPGLGIGQCGLQSTLVGLLFPQLSHL